MTYAGSDKHNKETPMKLKSYARLMLRHLLAAALLGSVSDHVVRNATCPVVITSHPEGED